MIHIDPAPKLGAAVRRRGAGGARATVPENAAHQLLNIRESVPLVQVFLRFSDALDKLADAVREGDKDETIMKWLPALAVLAALSFYYLAQDNSSNNNFYNPLTPSGFIAGSVKKSQVEENGDKVYVSFPLPGLTIGTDKNFMNVTVASTVPKVFAKFPQVNTIVITGTGKFNESTGTALRMTFTRANASTIKWDKISYSDLPEIANNYWQHPGITRAENSN